MSVPRQHFLAGWVRPTERATNPQAEERTYFRRYVYRNYRIVSGITHQIARRVTVTGWVVLCATMAAAALGADTNVSLSYQTFSLLGCLVLVAGVAALFRRPRLSAERVLPKFGSVGETLRYRITVRNNGERSQGALSLIDEATDPRPSFEDFVRTPEPGEERRNWVDRKYGYYRWRWLLSRSIRAHIPEQPIPNLLPLAQSSIAAELMPLRRGVLRLTGITVACPDPFGLFRSLRNIPAPQSVLILPRRYPMPAFELPGTMKYQHGGVSLASSVGESEEFVSLREYRPGDPMRRVHWKSFAKLGKPIVKEYQDEFFVRHALILDTFGGAGDGEMFEEAVSVAASLAYTIQNQDSLLDLMFIGSRAYCFTSGRGVGHVEQMLEILASVQVCQAREFESLEHLVLTHTGDLSGCVCVLLAWDEPRQRLVKSLLTREVPLRVFVVTQSDEPVPLGVMAGHADHFHHLPLGQVAAKLQSL
jgi:uncharacterized protein (DUF58 family)